MLSSLRKPFQITRSIIDMTSRPRMYSTPHHTAVSPSLERAFSSEPTHKSSKSFRDDLTRSLEFQRLQKTRTELLLQQIRNPGQSSSHFLCLSEEEQLHRMRKWTKGGSNIPLEYVDILTPAQGSVPAYPENGPGTVKNQRSSKMSSPLVYRTPPGIDTTKLHPGSVLPSPVVCHKTAHVQCHHLHCDGI